MYPEFIEMGYSPEKFLLNGLDEKCSLYDIKSLNLSFLKTYKAKSIEMYIGFLISIYADHIDNNYNEHLRLLKAYISPQKNRAVKNNYYFYSYYGKEETYHIKNQD